MDKYKIVIVAGVTAALVASLFVGIFVPDSGSPGRDGKDGVTVGAVASPDIMSPYVSWGSVRQWAARDADLTAASTTICAIQSPAATSSLMHASVVLEVSSTSASTLTMAKASTAFATTTLMGREAIAANAKALIVASTSPTTYEANIFNPNQWIVVSMEGGAVGTTFSPTGVCEAVWVEL